MKFEINDKVRIKKSKALEKLYGNPSHECWSACEDIIMDADGSEVRCAKSGVWVNGALQLILESPKLSLRLSQKGLTLKVKILHQDESLRCEEEITSHEDYTLESCNCPELSGYTLFIRGEDTDNVSPKYKFNTQTKLEVEIKQIDNVVLKRLVKWDKYLLSEYGFDNYPLWHSVSFDATESGLNQ